MRQTGKTKELKVGSLVKAYVLFKKKDKGLALTLDKAKAKELRKEAEEKQGKSVKSSGDAEALFTDLESYFPSAEELNTIREKYKSLIKTS